MPRYGKGNPKSRYGKSGDRSGKRASSYMDQTQHHGTRPPYGEESKEVQVGLSTRALRDLPHSSYSVMADPYTASLPTSRPYPIIASFNKHVGGSYLGDKNIDGGNVQQYANSLTSLMLKIFDVLRLKIKINYRYLPIKPWEQGDTLHVGEALIDEMRKSIAEAVSTLKSTTFTQMAINNFAVDTDLPMGSATKTDITPTGGSTPIRAYTNLTDVLYSMAVYYQLFLQNIANTMNWHNSFRLKQGEMIRNAWNREVSALNSLFGLFNKKAFLNKLDSINLSFEGEFTDVDFLKQASMLNIMPSRRSESLTDPVLELQTSFAHPSYFRVYLLDSDSRKAIDDEPFFSDSMLVKDITFPGEPVEHVSIWGACEELNNLLSMEATTVWARTYMHNSDGNDNYRYNRTLRYFDVVSQCFTTFKPLWSDFREALDVLARAGVINWTKGFRPSITRDTNAPFFQNLVTDDIYKFILGGASSVVYDEATKRWRTFSMWDMYKGIPEYDTYAGGCFLTFSFKDLDVSADTDGNVKYLPVLFNKQVLGTSEDSSAYCVAVSRDGVQCYIETLDIQMSANADFARLAPLASQGNLRIRVPFVSTAHSPRITTGHMSYLLKMLTQIVGYGGAVGESVHYHVDPDIVAVYQIEIEDVTNMAITYARANGPIRGTTSSEGLLGFMGMRK